MLVGYEPISAELPSSPRARAGCARGSASWRRPFVVTVSLLRSPSSPPSPRTPTRRIPREGRHPTSDSFLSNDAVAARRYRLRLPALQAAAERIVPGAGIASRGALPPPLCAEGLAERLDRPLVSSPAGSLPAVCSSPRALPRPSGRPSDLLLSRANGIEHPVRFRGVSRASPARRGDPVRRRRRSGDDSLPGPAYDRSADGTKVVRVGTFQQYAHSCWRTVMLQQSLWGKRIGRHSRSRRHPVRGTVEQPGPNEPFHHRWEARIFAIGALSQTRLSGANLDFFRFAIDRTPPAEYLGLPYYNKWLRMTETLLTESGVIAQGRSMRGCASGGERGRGAARPGAAQARLQADCRGLVAADGPEAQVQRRTAGSHHRTVTPRGTPASPAMCAGGSAR